LSKDHITQTENMKDVHNILKFNALFGKGRPLLTPAPLLIDAESPVDIGSLRLVAYAVRDI